MLLSPDGLPQNEYREPTITKKTDGYMMIFIDSTARYMSAFESFLYRFFGVKPTEYKEHCNRFAAWHEWKHNQIQKQANEARARSGTIGTMVDPWR